MFGFETSVPLPDSEGSQEIRAIPDVIAAQPRSIQSSRYGTTGCSTRIHDWIAIDEYLIVRGQETQSFMSRLDN